MHLEARLLSLAPTFWLAHRRYIRDLLARYQTTREDANDIRLDSEGMIMRVEVCKVRA